MCDAARRGFPGLRGAPGGFILVRQWRLMNKPSHQREPEQIQKRARAAAVRLFSRHGFEGTSVQAIADEVGTSKQALLYHFSSKEGLRAAAIEEMVETWRAALPRFLSALTRKEAPFDEALGEIVSFFRAEPAYARFLMQELLSGTRHPAIADVSTWLGFAAGFIRQAQADGAVAAEVDPEAWVINAGTFILSALSLLDSEERPGASLPDSDRVLRELARMIGSSLRPHR
jgi:TetR/AcrR family transcriptional regulator